MAFLIMNRHIGNHIFVEWVMAIRELRHATTNDCDDDDDDDKLIRNETLQL